MKNTLTLRNAIFCGVIVFCTVSASVLSTAYVFARYGFDKPNIPANTQALVPSMQSSLNIQRAHSICKSYIADVKDIQMSSAVLDRSTRTFDGRIEIHGDVYKGTERLMYSCTISSANALTHASFDSENLLSRSFSQAIRDSFK